MARVNKAREKGIRLGKMHRNINCCGYFFFIYKIFTVKDTVAKQLFNGRLFTEIHNSVKLLVLLLATRHSPIWGANRDKKIKALVWGSCATVQEAVCSSICNANDLHACGNSSQTALQLKMEMKVNHSKSIAVPKFVVSPSRRWNHVTPKTVIGFWTRSPVKFKNMLNVCGNFKGTDFFVRSLTTDCPQGFELEVEKLLADLKANSIENNIAKVNICVGFLLGMPEFWMLCYERIKSNPGCFSSFSSEGSYILDSNEKPNSLDGIDLDFFQKLSSSILKGNFKFGPMRRIELPKSYGSSRFFANADSRDKIVQKGMAVILECLSEHRFLECSFGFRHGKSCHDALAFIQKKVPSGLWAIEGDISKCFDHFDHKKLASLIKKKYVNQQVFIDLIYKALNGKIVKFDSFFKKKLEDTFQGSFVSPILYNIYLNELDTFVVKSDVLAKFRGGKAATANSKFVALLKPTKEELKTGETIKKLRGKLKMWKYFHKLRVSKLKIAKIQNIQRTKFSGKNRKYAYVRYVDNFVIFVWGTKNDCLEIKSLVKIFSKGNLHLDLSGEKTRITYLKKEKTNFLGFQLWQSPSTLPSCKSDVNPLGKIDRLKTNSKFRGATMQVPRLRITFSMDTILRKLVDKGLLKFKAGKFFPTSYKPALQYDISNIVIYIKAIFGKIAYYFGFAHNWYDAKSLYNYFGRFCAAMTIAHKTKSKVPKVFKKYGNNLTILSGENKVIAKFDLLSNKIFKRNVKNNFDSLPPNPSNLLVENLKIAKQHLIKWPCVICGEKSEMHHIKHVRKMLSKKKSGSFDAYLEAMRLVNRKTLPVCKFHHQMIHNGKYDGESLKSLFESFKKKGVGFDKVKAAKLIKKIEVLASTQIKKFE